jgi:anti-anti-sigma factor
LAQRGRYPRAWGEVAKEDRVLSFRLDGRMLSVTGEMDAASSADLRAHLAQVAAGGPFVLDMTEVSCIDSAGLRQLIWAANQGEGRLRIVPSPSVAGIFHITGLDQRPEIVIEAGDKVPERA